MDLLLGWAAFAGGVVVVSLVRSFLVARLGWRRGAATAFAMGAPLLLALIAVALAIADASSSDGSGGVAAIVVVLFPAIALAVGAAGVALSKLVRGEFTAPGD